MKSITNFIRKLKKNIKILMIFNNKNIINYMKGKIF